MGLEFVEFWMAVEEEFGFPVEEIDAARILTVGDMVDYLGRKTGLGFVNQIRVGRRYVALTEERLLAEVIRVLEMTLGEVGPVDRSSRFVEDLGMG